MIIAITINKIHNNVIFHHYHNSKQYNLSPDCLRWIESQCKRDNWKCKPNGYTFDGKRYVPITTDNNPIPFYMRPNIRFVSIVINWSKKTIRFTDMYHKDRTYTVKSVKRLRRITSIIEARNDYLRYESENWSNWNRHGRKLEKYTSYTIR